MEMLQQKLITDPLDLLEEPIIDFNRARPLSAAAALRTMFSWFDHRATLTSVRISDWADAPPRGNFPGWNHVGGHEPIGRRYWDWFFWHHPGGELWLSDSPDFQGWFPFGVVAQDGSALYGEPRCQIWGDIGRVSATAFLHAQKQLRLGDIWVSVLDNGNYHIIIEPHVSIRDEWAAQISLADLVGGRNRHIIEERAKQQLARVRHEYGRVQIGTLQGSSNGKAA